MCEQWLTGRDRVWQRCPYTRHSKMLTHTCLMSNSGSQRLRHSRHAEEMQQELYLLWHIECLGHSQKRPWNIEAHIRTFHRFPPYLRGTHLRNHGDYRCHRLCRTPVRGWQTKWTELQYGGESQRASAVMHTVHGCRATQPWHGSAQNKAHP